MFLPYTDDLVSAMVSLNARYSVTEFDTGELVPMNDFTALARHSALEIILDMYDGKNADIQSKN